MYLKKKETSKYKNNYNEKCLILGFEDLQKFGEAF